MVKLDNSEITYIAFLECVFRGLWITTAEEKEDLDPNITSEDYNEHTAFEMGAELWVVMPDRLRRAFSFKKHSNVRVYSATIRFDQGDVIEELAVDEEKQFGKRK